MIYCNQYYLIDPKQNPIVDMKTKRFKEPNFTDNEKFFKVTQDKYGLGYIEHLNVDDSTATFVYTILFGTSTLNEWSEEFSRTSRDPWSSERDQLPPSIILSKGDDTHIFYDRDTDTTCYTCYFPMIVYKLIQVSFDHWDNHLWQWYVVEDQEQFEQVSQRLILC